MERHSFKMENFIKSTPQLTLKAPHRMYNIDFPYAKVVEDSKWQPHKPKEADTNIKGSIPPGSSDYGKGLLGRCNIGSFGNLKSEMPTLSDVRK